MHGDDYAFAQPVRDYLEQCVLTGLVVHLKAGMFTLMVVTHARCQDRHRQGSPQSTLNVMVDPSQHVATAQRRFCQKGTEPVLKMQYLMADPPPLQL